MSAKTVKTTPVERDADLGPAGLRFAGSWPLGRLQAFANVRGDAEPSVNEELEFTAERLRQEVAARKRAEQRQRERELDLQQHIAELKDAR